MRHPIFIILGAVLISGIAFAGGEKEQMMKSRPAASEVAMTIAGAPENLHLKIVKDGFQLNWTLSPQDPGMVNGYEIVRSDRFSGPYETVANVEKGTSRYVDTSASREIIYFYKVRALAGKGSSSYSNTVSGER